MIRRFSINLGNYSKIQVQTLKDELFLVNLNDQVVGKLNKQKAHLNEWIYSKDALPHRAFSVFIFNTKDQLLLQQRSATKITFPLFWTNSCCSHPIKHDKSEGIVLESYHRTHFELGLDLTQYGHSQKLVQKVLYRAKYDENWGEYELDYLIFVKLHDNFTSFKHNNDEVVDVQWIDKKNVHDFVKNTDKVTPWFKRIVQQTEFEKWWESYMKDDKKSFAGNTIIQLAGE
ncbi:hypothetical protein SteCoe_26763 [Stentor coeruleus]|uniref:isopentenyl-diphosphate Delta-isomerase n=1 Tax=Stentor coeruleus TaxID=5963 RepID=A0A1R2BC49_9CILI|nr:hypothetical protein SteCoe_26763 [Stentor coeruleus]